MSRRPGQQVLIDEFTVLTITNVSGNKVGLDFSPVPGKSEEFVGVPIDRMELAAKKGRISEEQVDMAAVAVPCRA